MRFIIRNTKKNSETAFSQKVNEPNSCFTQLNLNPTSTQTPFNCRSSHDGKVHSFFPPLYVTTPFHSILRWCIEICLGLPKKEVERNHSFKEAEQERAKEKCAEQGQ